MAILDLFKKRSVQTRSSFEPYNINTWQYRSYNGDMINSDLVRACIDTLARNIAKMELQSVRVGADRKKVIDDSSDIARVLNHPNQYMTAYDFLYKVSAMYFISNNVFIWKEYDDGGNLISLYPIYYQNFHLKQTGNGTLYAQFQINYKQEYTVPYSELIHLRNHYMTDDILGDTNQAIVPAMELLNAQNTGIINGIKNSAIIRGILKATGIIKNDDLEANRKRFIQDNLTASNNGGVVIVDQKFDYQPIESKPYVIDSDTMEEAKKMIFNYFGVNEEFMQNKFTSDGYEAVYEGRLEPFATMLTQAMTYGLFTERERGFGNQVEANMEKLKYQPMSVITGVISSTSQLGLFTRDEYREMLGYTPLGSDRGGDELMIAVNNYSAKDSTGSTDTSQGDNNGTEN